MEDKIQAPDSLLGVKDAASFLGISESCMRLWEKHGLVPSIRFGGRLKFRMEDLERVKREGTGK